MNETVATANAQTQIKAEERPPHVSGPYRTYVMVLLLGIYIVNFLDRQVVNILAEAIKQDLDLADWQLGLMGGLAFAVLYTFMGVPIAMLAERKDRSVIISVAIAVWSVCTALCGLAQNFVQLVLARIGVGIGEAGCTPPAHSLIVDYAPREKRSSALAFYGMGAPIGGLLGMAFGGLVADAYGWRMAFFIAGAPGLVFALLAYFTLKDPRRTMVRNRQQAGPSQVTIRDTLRVLASKPSFYWAVGGISIKAFIAIGYSLFMASFFLRNHGEALANAASAFGGLGAMGFLGLTIGLISGIFGALGMWTGGQLADRFAAKDMRWYMWGSAIAAVAFIPPFALAMTVASFPLSLACMAVSAMIGTMHYGPAVGATLSVVPSRMRAPASAIHLFIANLIGLGLGPLAVGALSDQLAVTMGSAEGLRWALVIASLGGIPGALMFVMSARTLRENMES